MAVHVVGNVCLDTTFRLARFPEAGETLNADGCTVGIGGKGANQALAAARTGAETTLWTAVGRDAEGEAIRRLLIDAGLSDRGIAVVNVPTDRSSILLDAKAENIIVSAAEAARAFPAERSGWQAEARPGDVLVLQNNLAEDATAACLWVSRERRLFTVLNPSPLGPAGCPPFAGVDLVVVNRGEGEMLTGKTGPSAITGGLLSLGARRALVTIGAEGALLAGDGSAIALVPPPVTPRDTSGAGDVLCGTLAGLLSLGQDLEHAFAAAVRAAAVAVTRPGAFGSDPLQGELASLVLEETA